METVSAMKRTGFNTVFCSRFWFTDLFSSEQKRNFMRKS